MFRRGKMHKRDVAEYSFHLEDRLWETHEQLISGLYQHDPYEHFYVDDPKRRHISKASIRDRVVHQALVNAIEPVIEPSFIYDSFASRTGKGTYAAVERLDLFLHQASGNGSRRVFALKCDVRRYFDSIRHDLLLSMLGRYIHDARILSLADRIICSHTSDTSGIRGLPLGNVTSQLFANLYLNEFDHWVKEQLRMRWYIRFCDDFVILHADYGVLESLIIRIRDQLADSLGLELHPQKISIRTYAQGVDFVGWVLRPFVRTLRAGTRRRLFRLTQKESDFGSFRQAVQSCKGLLSFGNQWNVRRQLCEEVWRLTRRNSGDNKLLPK